MTKRITVFVSIVLFAFSEISFAQQQILLSALNSMERVGLSGIYQGEASAVIQSAKNEVESFQVIVSAPTEHLRLYNI